MMEGMTDLEHKKKKAICAVSPHAGMVYSGTVAGALFSSLMLPKIFVILGFNHRNYRSDSALMREGAWETPLGEVPIDSVLADMILSGSSLIIDDSTSHEKEHSIEVQLPFLQYFIPQLSIVPISVSGIASFEELKEMGKSIADSIIDSHKDVLILASTDMSHQVSQKVAEEKDHLAIQKILDLDGRGLLEIVQTANISMCGVQPTATALIASKLLGAQKGELIKYQTSGDHSGDYTEVVGYAGISIS